jgi:hypothetical protein
VTFLVEADVVVELEEEEEEHNGILRKGGSWLIPQKDGTNSRAKERWFRCSSCWH